MKLKFLTIGALALGLTGVTALADTPKLTNQQLDEITKGAAKTVPINGGSTTYPEYHVTVNYGDYKNNCSAGVPIVGTVPRASLYQDGQTTNRITSTSGWESDSVNTGGYSGTATVTSTTCTLDRRNNCNPDDKPTVTTQKYCVQIFSDPTGSHRQ